MRSQFATVSFKKVVARVSRINAVLELDEGLLFVSMRVLDIRRRSVVTLAVDQAAAGALRGDAVSRARRARVLQTNVPSCDRSRACGVVPLLLTVHRFCQLPRPAASFVVRRN